jgi:hypothetical protein
VNVKSGGRAWAARIRAARRNGLGGLLLPEAGEARFCQVDPLVVQIISERASPAGAIGSSIRPFQNSVHILREWTPRFLPEGPFGGRV